MLHKRNLENLNKLINIIEKLRAPDGCPWDREQSHKSLKENLLQETYEAIDAIESGNPEELKEELGDVLLQVILHSQIASEENNFDIEDETKVKGTQEVLANWEKIKREEKPERKSFLSGITKSQPALMTALQLSKKAVKAGFEWPDIESLWECLDSEIEEFKQALKTNEQAKIEDEFGDILFSLVNIARWHKIEPELALMRANKKFRQRFQLMEKIAQKNLTEYTQDELENLWQKAKKELQKMV